MVSLAGIAYGNAAPPLVMAQAEGDSGRSLDELQAEAARLRAELDRLLRELERGQGGEATPLGDEGTERPQPPPAAAAPRRAAPAEARPQGRSPPTTRSRTRRQQQPLLPEGEPPPQPPFLDIPFPPGSNELPEEALADLDQLAATYKLFNVRQILVVGFSDRLGDPVYNEQLAAARANIVAGELISRGIPPGMVAARGQDALGLAPPVPTPPGRPEPANRVAYIYLDQQAAQLLLPDTALP